MTTFQSFNLSPVLLTALERLNISEPSPIQQLAIPHALEGKDLLASAQTGTGKTFAYLLPLLMHLAKNPKDCAMILTPTRELAIQVKDNLIKFLERSQYFALLIGGEPMFKQFDQLRRNPQIIVGTPGRINDHLNRGRLNVSRTTFLVLDEMDRMLDLGFMEQLETIFEALPENRQTLMFSATVPPHIEKLSQKFLNKPERVLAGSTTQPIAQIQQDIIHTSDKFNHLIKELGTREGTVIVFVKTKISAEDISERLQDLNHRAEALHGGLQQRKRERVIRSFRHQKSRIIVATDVAARGLDIDHVRHVINYDLPQCPEDYIHRIGRTGRAGAQGFALCLIGPEDRRQWRAINQLMSGEKVTRLPMGGGAGARRSSGFAGKPSFGRRDSEGGRGGPEGRKLSPFANRNAPFERSERFSKEGGRGRGSFSPFAKAGDDNASGENRRKRSFGNSKKRFVKEDRWA